MKGRNESRAQDSTRSRLEPSEFDSSMFFKREREKKRKNTCVQVQVCTSLSVYVEARDQNHCHLSVCLVYLCDTGSLTDLEVTKEAELAA